jgi:hypothetical protein
MKASQAAVANMGLHSGMVSPVGRDCPQDFTRCSKASRPWPAKSSTKSPLAKVPFPTSSEVFFLQYFSIIRSLSHLDLGLPHLSGQFPVHHGESMPRRWLHLVAMSQCCKGIVEMLTWHNHRWNRTGLPYLQWHTTSSITQIGTKIVHLELTLWSKPLSMIWAGTCKLYSSFLSIFSQHWRFFILFFRFLVSLVCIRIHFASVRSPWTHKRRWTFHVSPYSSQW